MLRRLFELASINRHRLAKRAQRVDLRAAQDSIPFRRLRTIRIVLPSRARVDYDSLALPLRSTRASGDDDTAAVREEGDAEANGWVQVLSDEEVAVVECGAGDLDDDFVVFGLLFGDVDVLEGIVDLVQSPYDQSPAQWKAFSGKTLTEPGLPSTCFTEIALGILMV